MNDYSSQMESNTHIKTIWRETEKWALTRSVGAQKWNNWVFTDPIPNKGRHTKSYFFSRTTKGGLCPLKTTKKISKGKCAKFETLKGLWWGGYPDHSSLTM